MKMDDERHKMMFEELQKDCDWIGEMNIGGHTILVCQAGNVPCKQKHCMPFKFGLYFTKQK